MFSKKAPKATLFIRADASVAIGMGHVMRTLALADRAKEHKIAVYYLCFSLPKALEEKIESVLELKYIDDANEVIELAKIYNPFAIILDSYALNANYEATLQKGTNATIVSYEDLNNKHSSDLIINPNIYAYSDKKDHLFGSEWAMLRKEFKQKFHKKSKNFTLSVTLGGSDEKNITATIIQYLKKWHHPFTANIILGATNPHRHKIFQLIKSRKNFKLHLNPKNFASLLAASDIVISASGQTTIEVLHLKKPSIAINAADNQNAITQMLKEKKLALTLDTKHIKLFPRMLNRFYAHRNRYKKNDIQIEKHSVLREIIATHLQDFSLEILKESDCQELFILANEPLIRQMSLHSKPITALEHQSWCKKKFEESIEIYIAKSKSGLFLGYVRFEHTVSIALSKFARGYSLSKRVLTLALTKTSKKSITAQIKHDNSASIQLFLACNFKKIDQNSEYVTMQFEKS